jgi:serine/threonine protein kinase
MGTVYRAYDKARNVTVALKVLRQLDPTSLLRFKTEFRALANLAHPNLLQLLELVQHGEEYLLSMELVEGRDFLSFVRAEGAADNEAEIDEDTEVGPPTTRESKVPANDNRQLRRVARLDERKLRGALRQVVEGLQVLHASGHLHRDLKPANVLVFDRDERLVICDFGLIVERRAHPKSARHERDGAVADGSMSSTGRSGEIAGTLAFMSPEQAVGAELTPASDFYALGAMLYQALTLRVPFDPKLSWANAVLAKQEQVPDHPLTIDPEAPPELAELAMALLHAAPDKRAGYAEVRAVLDGTAVDLPAPSRERDLLIGRDREIDALQRAYARAVAGRASVALVSGRSGVGKSAIVQHVLTDFERRGALVLRGRCHECEDLPYKAFDPLMDALSAHLLSLEDDQVRALLSADVAVLAELFPVLRRVAAVAEQGKPAPTADPFERKHRASIACRQLLSALARTAPLVLYVDDLQWGDLDSGPLFVELLRGEDAPALLLFAYREEDEQTSPLLKAMREQYLPASGVDEIAQVRVGPLTQQDGERLAEALLVGVPKGAAAAQKIVSEAGGSPFFIHELASYVRMHGADSASGLTLDTVLESRMAALPEHSRTLLEFVAVSGRPEQQTLLYKASRLGQQAFAAGQILKAHNFVHSSGDARLEANHDRIREAAYKRLSDERRRYLHRLWATVLEADKEVAAERDVEALFEHWRRAGEKSRALEYALLAAQRAEAALAFRQAAKLYQSALELVEGDASEQSKLEGLTGYALMFAGRGAEAAEAFFRAMPGASEDVAQDFRRLAIVQLLGAGQLERAFAELKDAEDVFGLRFPQSNGKAIGMLLWRRLRTRLNDKALSKHHGESKEMSQRLLNLYRVSTALSTVDFLRGGVYTAEHTLRALEHGHPYHLATALSIEAIRSAGPNKKPALTQWIIERGMELAKDAGPYPIAVSAGTAGVSRYLEGRFEEAVRLTRESQRIHRQELNSTMAWDLVTMTFFEIHALAMIGRVNEIIPRVAEGIRDAEARGDMYAATLLRIGRQCWAWLGPDQPELAQRELERAQTQWVQEPYQLRHYYMVQAAGEIALYRDRAVDLWERAVSERKQMSLVSKIQLPRVQGSYLIGRLALSIARATGSAAGLPEAKSCAKSLQNEAAWTRPLGRLLAAACACFQSTDAALELLQGLPAELEQFDMKLLAAVARYRTGQLQADGTELVARARSQIAALGVSNPEAFVRMLAPGFPEP